MSQSIHGEPAAAEASEANAPGIHRPNMAALLLESLKRLSPRSMARNPVMAVVAVGTLVCALYTALALYEGAPAGFALSVTLVLLATVLFAGLL